jgi:hypothetical protein
MQTSYRNNTNTLIASRCSATFLMDNPGTSRGRNRALRPRTLSIVLLLVVAISPASADIFNISGLVVTDFPRGVLNGHTLDLGRLFTDGTCTICTPTLGDLQFTSLLESPGGIVINGDHLTNVLLGPTFDRTTLTLSLEYDNPGSLFSLAFGPTPTFIQPTNGWIVDQIGALTGTYTISAAVPEPASWLLLGTLLLAASRVAKRGRRVR